MARWHVFEEKISEGFLEEMKVKTKCEILCELRNSETFGIMNFEIFGILKFAFCSVLHL